MNDLKYFLLSVKDVSWPDFKKLTNWSYLSESAVPVQSSLLSAMVYFFLFLIILGQVLNFYLNRKNNQLPVYSILKTHIFNMTLWLGSIGLLLVIARYEALYILSSRLLLMLLMIILIAWTIWIIIYALTVLPEDIKKYHQRQKFQKYLPKKKKIIR